MQPVIKEKSMATKKESADPRTTPVKLDTGLVKKAKIVASAKGINLSEYIAEAVRGTVERDWTKVVRQLAAEDK
jgi:predicted DNA binding CopG/RHH family protein